MIQALYSIIERLFPSHQRTVRVVRSHQEILNDLPESARSRAALTAHIDSLIVKMIEDQQVKRRDPQSVVIGLILLAPLGTSLAVGHWLTAWGYLGLIVAAPIALLGLFGIGYGLTLGERDERGNLRRTGRQRTESEEND